MAIIGGINIIKLANNQNPVDLSVFHGIGTCEKKIVADAKDIEQLSEHYLVWYKPNEAGDSGWNIEGSINYLLNEYMNELTNESMNTEVKPLIKSFSKGLEKPVEILVAYDTDLNAGLIIDGTKRAIALYYLKHKKTETFSKIIGSNNHQIQILQLNSPSCRVLFPCDFLKLCFKKQVNK
jgi:hypothetical protein